MSLIIQLHLLSRSKTCALCTFTPPTPSQHQNYHCTRKFLLLSNQYTYASDDKKYLLSPIRFQQIHIRIIWYKYIIWSWNCPKKFKMVRKSTPNICTSQDNLRRILDFWVVMLSRTVTDSWHSFDISEINNPATQSNNSEDQNLQHQHSGNFKSCTELSNFTSSLKNTCFNFSPSCFSKQTNFLLLNQCSDLKK
jgi:hypothetical protein